MNRKSTNRRSTKKNTGLTAENFKKSMNPGNAHNDRLVKAEFVLEAAGIARRTFYNRLKDGTYRLSRVVLSGTTEKPETTRYLFSEVLQLLPISDTERESMRDVWMIRWPEFVPVSMAAGLLAVSPALIYKLAKSSDPDNRLETVGEKGRMRIRKTDLLKFVNERTYRA